MKNLWILIALVTVGFTSCQKVIDVDLNDADPKIVIEATYNGTDSLVHVKVSYTASFFDDSEPTLVNDASVMITDGNGTSTIVPTIGNGMYELPAYAPSIGTTYTVTVIHNGTTYTATSTLMPTLVQQTPIFDFYESGFFGEDGGYLVSCVYQDPSGLGNCYKAILTANDTVYDALNEILIGDDLLTDGNLIERPAIQFFQAGDTISYELQSIDQGVYEYYNELLTLAGGQQSAAPANPTYYWTNEALGYFSAYTYSKNGVTIVE